MKNKIIISSILTIALCLSLIAGSTFALFTSEDQANIAVTSANVEIDAEIDTSSQDNNFHNAGTTATFNGNKLILTNFAPLDSLEFTIKVTNKSTIAIAYKVSMVANNTSDLSNTLDPNDDFGGALKVSSTPTFNAWTVVDPTTSEFRIPVMVEFLNKANNNDFMKQTIEIAFNVEAVQANGVSEVATADALKAAIASGETATVSLTDDVAIDEVIRVSNDLTILTNGNDLNIASSVSRPFELADGASLTIDATGSTEVMTIGAAYGLINVPSGNANITLKGGVYEGNTDNGAFIRVRNGATANIVLDNVKYTDTSADGFIINADGAHTNIVINGGEFSAFAGIQAISGNLSVNGASFTTGALAFEVVAANAEFNNSTIVIDPGKIVGTAPAAALATSHNGKIVANNCNIIVADGVAAYWVYSSGGSLEINNCTAKRVDGSAIDSEALYNYVKDLTHYPNARYKVVIDGVVKVDE